jgi:hypothetical protein
MWFENTGSFYKTARRHRGCLRGGGVLLLAPLFLLLGGCGAKAAPSRAAEDLSKPLPALMTYLNAIAKCDSATAKSASVGTEADKRWIDAMTALIGGLRSYDQALVQRFGREAVQMDDEIRQAIAEFTTQPIVRFQDGLVSEGPDRAEIQAAIGHIRLAAQSPVYMKRQKDGWKVDLTVLRQDPRHDPAVIAEYLAAGESLSRAAKSIRQGRYGTFADAQQAVGDAMPGS